MKIYNGIHRDVYKRKKHTIFTISGLNWKETEQTFEQRCTFCLLFDIIGTNTCVTMKAENGGCGGGGSE